MPATAERERNDQTATVTSDKSSLYMQHLPVPNAAHGITKNNNTKCINNNNDAVNKK